jgi:hypothetical protein
MKMMSLTKLGVCLLLIGVALGHTAAQQASDQERVAKHKQTILARLKRDKVEYRGAPVLP